MSRVVVFFFFFWGGGAGVGFRLRVQGQLELLSCLTLNPEHVKALGLDGQSHLSCVFPSFGHDGETDTMGTRRGEL